MSEETKQTLIYLLCAVLGIGFFAAIILGQQRYVGWVLIALSPGALVWSVRRLMDNAKSRNWPTVKGEITKSQAWQYRYTRSGSKFYVPRLTYQYNVDGKIYTGGPLIFGKTGLPTEVLKPYPPGRAITVYYAPHDPRQNMLRPGNKARDYLVLLVPLGLLVYGLAMAHGLIFTVK